MALEKLLAAKFERMLREQIKTQIDDWELSNCIDKSFIHLFYKNDAALYAFRLTQEQASLIFYNTHRQARVLGAGTISLKQLEAAFQELANIRRSTVTIVFDPFKQKDTDLWLRKNNYTSEEGIYMKKYDPMSSKGYLNKIFAKSRLGRSLSRFF